MNKGRRLKHPVSTPILIGAVVAAAVCFGIALSYHRANGWIGIGALALTLAAGVLLMRGLKMIWERFFTPAMQPVPSPEQIRLQFMQTQGREPTVQEVQALHQMAVTEHNQALLNAGLVAGAFYLGFRAFHHGHAQRGNNSAGNTLDGVRAAQGYNSQGQYRGFK